MGNPNKPVSLEKIIGEQARGRDEENKVLAGLNSVGIGFHIPVKEFKAKTVESLTRLYEAKNFTEEWIEEENVESIRDKLKSLDEKLSSLYTTGIVALDESQKNPPVLVDYLGTLRSHIKEKDISKLAEELLQNISTLPEDQKGLTHAERDSINYNRIARYLNSINLITKDIRGEEIKLKDSKYRLTEKQRIIDQNIKLAVLVQRSIEYLNRIIDFTEEYKNVIPKPISQNLKTKLKYNIEQLILERIIESYKILKITLTEKYKKLISNIEGNINIKEWTQVLKKYSKEINSDKYQKEEKNIQKNLNPEDKEYFNNINNMLNFTLKRVELVLNTYTRASNERHK